MTDTETTLNSREKLYGPFEDCAYVAQNIKAAFRDSRNWDTLSKDKKEALEMIASKIARILNGDSNCSDSWHDISGYARLAEKAITVADLAAYIW